MYSQNNNRIITKYSEFLKTQKTDDNLDLEVPPPLLPKTVNPLSNSDNFEVEEFIRNEDSGRESSLENSNSSLTVISAQVHQIQSSPGKFNEIVSPEYKSSKFSELFSTSESHALFQRNLLLQSEEGAFLRDALIKSKSESDLISGTLNIARRISSGAVHVESVVEPSKANSFPSKTAMSPSLELDLRRELLNNIRAISRATFYEKLYTGGGGMEEGAESSDTNNNPSTTVANEELEEFLRTGSPGSHMLVSEKGELLVFETTPGSDPKTVESPQPPKVQSDKESSIHQWILSSQHESEADLELHNSLHESINSKDLELDEARAFESQHKLLRDKTENEVQHVQIPALENTEETGLYEPPESLHESNPQDISESTPPQISDSKDLNSQHAFNTIKPIASETLVSNSEQVDTTTLPIASESPTSSSEQAESIAPLTPVPSEYPPSNVTYTAADYPPSQSTHVASSEYPPSNYRHVESDYPNSTHNASDIILQNETPVLVSDLKNNSNIPNNASALEILSEPEFIPETTPKNLRKAEPETKFFNEEPQISEPDGGRRNSIFTPMFRKVEIKSPPPRESPSFSLSPVVADASTQVRYPFILPQRSTHDERKHIFRGPLPGVLLRTNMEQWVAKIISIFINGDEHFHRTEFRFRPGRDVHTFDALCDVLSSKFKLTRGVRFLFTIDGKPIWSIDDLKHGESYVVSSTKKFKALNYGGELFKKDDGNKRRNNNRPPSAPSSRNPPIIRVRRERSLNGVTWGSPQQESSGSEGRAKIQNEAEKVIRAAIHETQLQNQTAKIVIRIINGSDPTIQSQVLLNTRVSEEWEDLVKDLGLAVKIPRTKDARMETLTGRPIMSYSQLRSQLKAGNQAFYIYNASQTPSTSIQRSKGRNPGVTYISPEFGSIPLPKSQSHPSLPVVENSLGLKFPNSIVHKTNQLTVPQHHPTHYNSQPNLIGTRQTQRRKSTRERYEKSRYLGHRSRSPSP